MFTVRWRPVAPGTFSFVLARPSRAVTAFMKRVPGLVFHSHVEDIQRTFAVEGFPPWARLAMITGAQRIQQGYDPEHPILERTGSFRRAMEDPVLEVRPLGKEGIQVRLGVRDPRFIWFQEGTRTMPARPVVPDTALQKGYKSHEVGRILAAALDDIVWEI